MGDALGSEEVTISMEAAPSPDQGNLLDVIFNGPELTTLQHSKLD